MTPIERLYRSALELIQADRTEREAPAKDRADLVNVAVLALRTADGLLRYTDRETRLDPEDLVYALQMCDPHDTDEVIKTMNAAARTIEELRAKEKPSCA